MKLLNEIVVKRPKRCHDCQFHSYDGSRSLCRGREIIPYFVADQVNGGWMPKLITPEEAIERGTLCMFIDGVNV